MDPAAVGGAGAPPDPPLDPPLMSSARKENTTIPKTINSYLNPPAQRIGAENGRVGGFQIYPPCQPLLPRHSSLSPCELAELRHHAAAAVLWHARSRSEVWRPRRAPKLQRLRCGPPAQAAARSLPIPCCCMLVAAILGLKSACRCPKLKHACIVQARTALLWCSRPPLALPWRAGGPSPKFGREI